MVITRQFQWMTPAALLLLAACASTPQSDTGLVNPDVLAGDYLQGRFAASQQDYDDAASAFDRAAGRQPDANRDVGVDPQEPESRGPEPPVADVEGLRALDDDLVAGALDP